MNISPISYSPKYNINQLKTVTEPTVMPEDNLSFKAKNAKEASKFTKFFAEYYGKTILTSKPIRNFAKWLNKVDSGDASRHFQVIGSFVTSSAYMKATLDNKDIEKKNATTLAINQGLGFVVPTFAAYFIDSLMSNFNKTLEYNYSAKQEKKLAQEMLSEADKLKEVEKLGKRLKGFRTLIGIITFTTVYRYLTPVLITPLANKIGNWFNDRSDAKKAKVEESENAGKEIAEDMKENSQDKAAKVSAAA